MVVSVLIHYQFISENRLLTLTELSPLSTELSNTIWSCCCCYYRHAAMKMTRHVPALKFSDDEIPVYYGYKWILNWHNTFVNIHVPMSDVQRELSNIHALMHDKKGWLLLLIKMFMRLVDFLQCDSPFQNVFMIKRERERERERESLMMKDLFW